MRERKIRSRVKLSRKPLLNFDLGARVGLLRASLRFGSAPPAARPSRIPGASKSAAAIVLCAALLPVATNCAALQDMTGVGKTPGFTLDRLEFTGVDLQKLSLRLHTTVDNPYPVAVPRAATDLGLGLEGSELFRIQTDVDGGIDARGSRALQFDVQLPYAGLINAYNKAPGSEILKLSLTGPVKLFLPEGVAVPGLPDHMTFDVQQETEFPAVRPTIDIRNFSIQKPTTADLTGAVGPLLAGVAGAYIDRLLSDIGSAPGSALSSGLANLDFNLKTEYEIVLKNEAAARLDFTKLNYTLFLENDKLFDGVSSNIENTGTESVVKIVTSLPLRSITSGLSRAIKSKNAGFRIAGDAGFDIPAMPLKELLNLDFNQTGRLTW
jgi:hypothetical protein